MRRNKIWVLWLDSNADASYLLLSYHILMIMMYSLYTFNCQHQPVNSVTAIWDINGKSHILLGKLPISNWSSSKPPLCNPQSKLCWLCCLCLHSSICGCNNGRLQPQFLNKTLHPRVKFFTNWMHCLNLLTNCLLGMGFWCHICNPSALTSLQNFQQKSSDSLGFQHSIGPFFRKPLQWSQPQL